MKIPDLASRSPAFAGYEKGVPMGGDLPERVADRAPTLMVCSRPICPFRTSSHANRNSCDDRCWVPN